jgi:agmatinase
MSFDPDAPASGDGLFGLPFSVEAARVVVVPVPWEATTSYRRGTRSAPALIREASMQVDLLDIDYGEAWKAGIALAPDDPKIATLDKELEASALSVIAALSQGASPSPKALEQVNRGGAILNARVYTATRRLLEQGRIPGILGGDHSTPFGAIQAAAEFFPGIGILHIDAHADLRRAYEGFTWSHASIFYNVMTEVEGIGALTQVGIRDFGAGELAFQKQDARIHCFFDATLAEWEAGGMPFLEQIRQILKTLPKNIWISLDIDGLDPALCPNTGTPVPGGLSWRQLCLLLKEASQNHQIIGFDLNEVGSGEWDAVVGARTLYKLCGAAICSYR